MGTASLLASSVLSFSERTFSSSLGRELDFFLAPVLLSVELKTTTIKVVEVLVHEELIGEG